MSLEESQWPVSGIVVDEKGKPLPGVTVTLRDMKGTTPGHTSQEAVTDQEGKWKGTVGPAGVLVIYEHPRYIRLQYNALHDGLEIEALRGTTVLLSKGEHRVAMRDRRGTAIGGLVVDDAGQPVVGATIDFYFHRDDDPKVYPDIRITPPDPIVTDRDGRWRWDDAPERLEQLGMEATSGAETTRTSVMVPSLAQLKNRDDARTLADRKVRCQQLREKTYRIGAYRPFALRGVVVDEQGRPVAGAQITGAVRAIVRERDVLTHRERSYQVAHGGNYDGKPRQTDTNGGFCFDFTAPDPREMDEYQVMVQRDGGRLCGWVAYPFPLPGESIRLILPAGEPLEVQAIDADRGTPIAGAGVVLGR
jgi:protocatechuate 3,4-dioxygenase beta subunit